MGLNHLLATISGRYSKRTPPIKHGLIKVYWVSPNYFQNKTKRVLSKWLRFELVTLKARLLKPCNISKQWAFPTGYCLVLEEIRLRNYSKEVTLNINVSERKILLIV